MFLLPPFSWVRNCNPMLLWASHRSLYSVIQIIKELGFLKKLIFSLKSLRISKGVGWIRNNCNLWALPILSSEFSGALSSLCPTKSSTFNSTHQIFTELSAVLEKDLDGALRKFTDQGMRKMNKQILSGQCG